MPENLFSVVPHEYFSKLCLKVCMLVEFWLSFFPSNTFLSSPLPIFVDPRLSGAEWEWRLVIHQSTLFTFVTSGVMETAYPPSQALVRIWRNSTVDSRAYFRGRNKNVTAATHLRCTPVGRTGPSSAGVLGCSGGSSLPLGRRHSGLDRARTASFWSGRSPLGRRPDTHPGRGTWAPQTYLHMKIKDNLGERKWPRSDAQAGFQFTRSSSLLFFFLSTARFGFLGVQLFTST